MNYKHYIDNGHAKFDKNDCLWQNLLETGEGWRASDCNTKLPFMCKTPADPSAPPTSASPVTSSTPGPRECPEDWTEFSGACYLHQTPLVSWYGAAYQCQALGGNLTSVLSKEEEQFINELATSYLDDSPWGPQGTFHLGGYITGPRPNYIDIEWVDESEVTTFPSSPSA